MFRACHTFLSLDYSLVVTCWERALMYVMFYCVFSDVVPWVRCVTWLYWFLIFASLLTLLFRYAAFGALSSFAINSLRKRELVSFIFIALCLLVFRVTSTQCPGLVCSVWLWHALVIMTYIQKVRTKITIATRSMPRNINHWYSFPSGKIQ